MNKREIAFIGSGNVAWHLARAMDRAGHTVSQIISRKEEHAFELARQFGAYYGTDLSRVYDTVDLCLICVGDDDLESVVTSMPPIQAVVAHTCGPKAMNVLADKFRQYGVFYPLQSFSKLRPVDMLQVPIMLEASSNAAYSVMRDVADAISNKVSDVSSNDRLKYHLAAVFANNFVNHLYHTSERYLQENQLNFDYLRPIIEETAMKIKSLDPADAQTGPARRGDDHTIERHLKMLQDDPDLRQLYQLFSDRITKQFNG